MITDSETNLLYLADCLPVKYPPFYKRFKKALDKAGVNNTVISTTKDIWAKDYMPVQISKDKFVKFIYNPGYLQSKKWLKTITDSEIHCLSYPALFNAKRSNLIVDGGNVVRAKNKVIMCDQVFSENPSITKNKLISQLEEELEVGKIIFVPKQPSDIIGHADGMVRFLDNKTVLINDYSKESKRFQDEFHASLKAAKLDWEVLPCNPYNNKKYIQANGIYINYLQMKGKIFATVFKKKEDKIALKKIESLFKGVDIIPIECNDIANEGGVLNCISWNVYQKPITAKQMKKYWKEIDRDLLCAGLD